MLFRLQYAILGGSWPSSGRLDKSFGLIISLWLHNCLFSYSC